MPKILTDKKLIEKFLTRGVEVIYPNVDELRKKLNSSQRLKVYQGFDPTGPYLHVGHAMGIRALRILQELGHEVIFLVGDYTAKVGDPDKNKARKLLTDEEIEKNMAGWKEQAGQLIHFSGKNAVRFERNYRWLSKLKLENLIELMSHMTVQRMLERDMFERRIEKNDPIYLQEFIYPLMQGYDSTAMKIDLEIGGTDQIFNMLVGRNLVRAYLNKEKFVRANKMMDAPDNRTMSKTKGNGINLSDSSEDMYGKAMSYPDSAIITGLELLTDVSVKDIKEIKQQINKGANPMQFKKLMAFEVVKIIKGEKQAQKAQAYFEKTVQKKEKPDKMPVIKLVNKTYPVIDLLVKTKLTLSKAQAKRLIEQGAVRINNQKITDWQKSITFDKETIVQVGKRGFAKIQTKD